MNPDLSPLTGRITSDTEVAALLDRCVHGESGAFGDLADRLYPELRRVAELRLRSERTDHTLQPTALVNEFFLEFARNSQMSWNSRAHFLAVASRAMRRILIDYARAQKSQKRGGGALRVQLDGLELGGNGDLHDTIEVSDLLDKLAEEEPRMATVVEMKCYGGLTFAEIGESLRIDERTAKRDWNVARAWLWGQLRKRRDDG
ncbi:MAG: RNA polymerase subunit sigma-70 [Acidobacteria bacterium]|nr:RNA polymerase subunit sigma-70 [Acidobacteriota bacterium]